MKICVAQTKPINGDIAHNRAQHKALIAQAVDAGADMIVFPELSLTGYEPTLADSLAVNLDDSIFNEFQGISDEVGITLGVGAPIWAGLLPFQVGNQTNEGAVQIGMVIMQPHQPRQLNGKRYLHDDELPYFASGQNLRGLTVQQVRIGLAICYELSVPEHAEATFAHGADLYVASVAEHERGVAKSDARLADIAWTYGVPTLRANCVGPSDDFYSVGQSAVWNAAGEQIAVLSEDVAGILIYDTVTKYSLRAGVAHHP